ncbi:ATP-binding protein [Actinacidiphila glaucinigra]|uniref:AlbA family DNA-binding domain-containing protein n=1 Tax=Actinacidiphila glaucinigra TaxID=235986 RepID=UPI002E3657B3|nr:ATP-binding protein [Actinacidiphila glaucinigra]
MARSWTRLHEHLGATPGPLDFDTVAKAAADRLAESDDLDWKEQLPQPPREGCWNELAKDITAMANTRGGLIIFGVRDTTCELVGIDLDEVNIEQYAQWVRNHVQPYLPDLTFTVLTSADGATSVLMAEVPASPMAPHLVYGTAARDKDQQAAVAPYRDRDHTAWMAEHQLERAYRDRFTRARRAEDEAHHLLAHAQETVVAQHIEPAAYFLALARPERPLPRTAPRLTREEATAVAQAARRQGHDPMRPGPLTSLEIVTGNPRPGLRRWVLSTLLLPGAREVHAELHHDGTVLLAANVSWHAVRNLAADAIPHAGVAVSQDFIGACCRDLTTTAWELARRLHVDSALQLTATLTAVTPSPTTPPPALVPVITAFGGFSDVPDYARHPRRIQPVTATLTPLDEAQALAETAQELFAEVMNQFGLDPQL